MKIGVISHKSLRRWVPVALLMVCAAPLGTALTAEHIFGVFPCDLCLYQRIPFALSGLLALALIIFRPRRTIFILAVSLAALAFSANAGIAFYQVGVEQHWWVSSCAGLPVTELSAADMIKELEWPRQTACDKGEWTFLGISMAAWNVPYCLILAWAFGTAAWRLSRAS